MRKRFFLFIFLLFFCYLIYPVKILWWNVENLFDDKDDPNTQDTIIKEDEYLKKINNISLFLKKVEADIVGLAEVENIALLKKLANISGYPFFYLIEGNDPRGIDIGMMSKVEVLYYKSHKDMKTPYKDNYNYKFSRDCPEALVKISGREVYILLNHLKSSYKDDEKSIPKRIAQVKGILDIIAGIYKKKENPYVLIVGDFNSTRYSEPMNILEKSSLVILNYLVDEKKLYTIKLSGKKRDIDYFLVNKYLYDSIKIKRIVAFHSKDFEIISDHYPFLFEFDFK